MQTQATSLTPSALQPAAPNKKTLSGNHVLVRADNLRLLLPQADVVSTDYLQGKPELMDEQTNLLHVPDSTDGAVYVAMDENMRLLKHSPEDRFVTTSLQGVEVRWCWSEVRVILGETIDTWPLPPVLLSPYTPVHEIAAVGSEWVYVCSADILQQYVLASTEMGA